MSARRSVQSPPPGSTLPRSRGPSKWPLAMGAVTRYQGHCADPLTANHSDLQRHQET